MQRTRDLRDAPLDARSAPAACDLLVSSLRRTVPVAGALPPDRLRQIVAPAVERFAASGTGVVAHDSRGTIVGYAAYDAFEFHGEPTAFCPIHAHASVAGDEEGIHEYLYTVLADRWVREGIRKHLVTTGAGAVDLERRYHAIGFGRYVVDCVLELHDTTSGLELKASGGADDRAATDARPTCIRTAARGDLDALVRLNEESVVWYRSAPIFLRFEPALSDELEAYVDSPDADIFVAEADGRVVGFMGVQLVSGSRYGVLAMDGDATIDGIGAYLESHARGSGMGKYLLAACAGWARARGAGLLHVDFESANPAARAFWPRHFVPQVYSLMRHTHPDAAL